eukprot:2672001-Prymnesium_polylepis.1
MPTAQQLPGRTCEQPLSGGALGGLLTALVGLLARRVALAPDALKFCFRCTSAAVQLLLCHTSAAARDGASALAAEERVWRQLPWRLQLH